MVELGELGGEKWCHYNAAAARLYMKPRPRWSGDRDNGHVTSDVICGPGWKERHCQLLIVDVRRIRSVFPYLVLYLHARSLFGIPASLPTRVTPRQGIDTQYETK